MPARLLQRQISLLEYLTSADAIFGGGADVSPHPQGFDLAPLRLEASFSHEKRMEKIMAALPRTFELLGGFRASIVRDFVAACPAVDIRRIENARQFYDFVCTRWEAIPQPPYLRDVASCEFAMARLRINSKAQPLQPADTGSATRFRRNRDAVFLPCTYDIRPIFEGGASGTQVSEHQAAETPARRDLMIAILIPPGTDQPAIFEVPAPVYGLLVELDSWTDRAALGPMEGIEDLITDLADHGLLEVS